MGEDGRQRNQTINPVGAPIPLHRYRSFKKTHRQKRFEQIEVLAKQLALPASAIGVVSLPISEPKDRLFASRSVLVCRSLHLGFNIRHYPCTRHRALNWVRKHHNLTIKLTIKPSNEKVKRHSDKLREVIRKHKTVKQEILIGKLNPIIKGWCNYYSTVVSKKIFAKCDHQLWLKLRRWAKRRHHKKSTQWIEHKYWKTINNRDWIFATINDKIGYRLALPYLW